MKISMSAFRQIRRARFLSNTSGRYPASSEKTDLLGIAVFSSACVGAGALGIWQLKRYNWKTEVIKSTGEKLSLAPVALSTTHSSQELAQFAETVTGRRVCLKGEFDHSCEVKVGPRSAPASLAGKAQGMATNPQGFYIITPFRLENGKSTALINRGWIPKSTTTYWTRPVGTVEIVAVVSEFEKKAKFSPENLPGGDSLLWLEESALMTKIGLDKYQKTAIIFEELRNDSNALLQYPVCRNMDDLKEQRVMPITHLVYSATWFMLATAGVFMTYTKFKTTRVRRRP